MPELSINSTVGEWAANFPQTTRVFETRHIDYCCGGNVSLEQVCRQQKLDADTILEELTNLIEASTSDETEENWNAASLTDLCDHIEQTHHAYLREELPRLTSRLDKVFNAHGGNHPELAELQAVFSALRSELEPHMFKEERVLFPAIRQLEQLETQPEFPFGSVGNPIRMMEHEHDNAGNALAQIRRLTSDFKLPDDACNTYRALFDGLETLERDLHQHIHKENNILFPKAAALESAAG